MAQQLPEPRPTFTLVDLLAGYVTLGILGWLLGGVAGIALSWGWTAGSRVGGWSGVGVFTILVGRTIWLAMFATPSHPRTGTDAEPGAAPDLRGR